jgi:hypothetical protein
MSTWFGNKIVAEAEKHLREIFTEVDPNTNIRSRHNWQKLKEIITQVGGRLLKSDEVYKSGGYITTWCGIFVAWVLRQSGVIPSAAWTYGDVGITPQLSSKTVKPGFYVDKVMSGSKKFDLKKVERGDVCVMVTHYYVLERQPDGYVKRVEKTAHHHFLATEDAVGADGKVKSTIASIDGNYWNETITEGIAQAAPNHVSTAIYCYYKVVYVPAEKPQDDHGVDVMAPEEVHQAAREVEQKYHPVQQ